MTEKRFKLFTGNNYGVQSDDGEVFIDSIVSIGDADLLVDLLNELSDKNEQLKSDVYDWKASAEDYLKLGKSLKEENEELKGDVEYWKNRFKEGEWHYEHIDEDRDVWHYKCTQLEKENKQLKQQLKNIEDSFKFSCTENHIEFNKDKLKVEDAHTELTLKDGKLCISVFVSQLNEYVKFFYWVTGRKMEREFINYNGDVE